MTKKVLICGTILSIVLNAIVLVLTIYHHFTVNNELGELKKRA